MDFTIQRRRCVCEVGGPASHAQHGRPGNQTGKHLDTRCPHSELYNTLVRYPAMQQAKAARRQRQRPMERHVGH